MLSAILKRVVKNSFFWALCIAFGTLGIVTYAVLFLQILQAVLAGGIALALQGFLFSMLSLRRKKWLLCELSLFWSTLAAALLPAGWKKQWYSRISDRITLGANPLVSRSHLEELKKQGHTAVLSLIEPFEAEPHLCGVPVKPQEWVKAGMAFLNLPTPDLTPVRAEDVVRAVAFLHQQISQGGRVYVHCNAGVIRSATIVICYLIAYCKMTAREAVAFVKARRSIVVSRNNPVVIDFLKCVQRTSVQVA